MLPDTRQAVPWLQVLRKNLRDQGRSGGIDPNAREGTGLVGIEQVAVGWPRPRQQGTRTVLVVASAPQPLSDECAFVFRNSTTNLE